ncbi:methyl-accepting chemotaxis protein [Paraburkholderia silviterrae]|nr:methyl-accepting chemotaxis protein [Paraburkholderia silviterrae]
MQIKNSSIGKKLTFAFCCVIVVFLLDSIVCFYALHAIASKTQETRRSESNLLALRDANTDYLNIIWAMLAYNLNGEPGHLEWKNDHIDDFKRSLAKVELSNVIAETEKKEVGDALRQYSMWVKNVVEPMFALRSKVTSRNVSLAELQKMQEDLGDYLGTDNLVVAMDKLDATEKKLVAEQVKEEEVLQNVISGSLVIATLLAITVAGLLGRWLTRSIRVPLAEAVGAAEAIAQGKLNRVIKHSYSDETGALLRSLETMQASLVSIVSSVVSGVRAINLSSAELAMGNIDLSARTEQQAASLEETAASMTQLTQTVKQNADNAYQANELATIATTMADTGNDAVQMMVATIDNISHSSMRISEITSLIEGIAFQTNILALNAAVEAARAGGQGRGFAVVASEVRSLAQRSAAAAKEINGLIGSSVAMIQEGSKQAVEVGATMEQVKQAIKQVSDIVAEIAAASVEQSRGIEQVNQAVNQMDKVTQQNAALVEQAAAAAQSLESQATKLESAVSVFNVGGAG